MVNRSRSSNYKHQKYIEQKQVQTYSDMETIKNYLNIALETIKQHGPQYTCKYGINRQGLESIEQMVRKYYSNDSEEAKQVKYLKKVLDTCR